MVIAYDYGNALYLNITNRCPCDCVFCLRHYTDGVVPGQSLWLERDPSLDEIKKAIQAVDFSRYDEIVFCGYGEPTERLDALLFAGKIIRGLTNLPVRLNTNGLSDLINKKKTAFLLAECIDRISISLNAPDKETYNTLCRPVFGEAAYEAIIDFALDCKECIPDVCLSVVERSLNKEQLERCAKICDNLGIKIKKR
jgi:radical SAM enzyme (TIGR04100 family)